MSETLIHEISLAGYKATSTGGMLDLGTWGSYGIEKLHLTLDAAWQDLTITAFFNVKGEVVAKKVVGKDGYADVPWEATKENTFAGRIVFEGSINGQRRISANLNYKVTNHSEITDSDPVPTDDRWNQFVTENKEYRDGAFEAAERANTRAEDAEAASDDAQAAARAASDAATGATDAKAAAVAAQKDAAASKAAAANSAAAAKTSEEAAAKSAADADRTANSINESMMQIAANKEAVSQLKEDIENTNSILEENLVRISANLINPDNMLENTAITISNRISTSSNTTYKSYLNIPVKAGESYYIGNSHRVSCVIDSAENKLVLQSNTQNKTGPFIFNVEKSGLLCVCFYMTEEKPWVALAEKETEYEEYGSKLLQEWLKLQIKKYGYSNPLKGKTIYNFGDSISNGQGNLVGDKRLGPAELVALDNDMVCTDFAVSGSTMSTAGGGNYILKRINDAISASPITPDFVLLAGGINDLKVTSVGDFSEPSSNDDFGEEYIGLLDTSNFSGAFETAIYRILNAWPGTQLIYMTEHKMPSHYNDGTETLYQTAEKICKKWCVPILDMWNSGGLNMSVLANNKAYGTGDVNLDGIHTDTTHPNGEAYRLYYVPKLKSKLLECCPKTN